MPATCYAGIQGLLQRVFGPSGPGFSIMLLVGLSIGVSLLSWLLCLFNKASVAKWISIIAGCIALGIVLKTVISLLDPTLSIFGY